MLHLVLSVGPLHIEIHLGEAIEEEVPLDDEVEEGLLGWGPVTPCAPVLAYEYDPEDLA